MNIIRFALTLIIILFIGCTNNNHPKNTHDLYLIEGDQIKFQLDKETGLYASNLQVYHEYLTFFNSKNNKIYFYNLKNKHFVTSIQLHTKGPKSLGPLITGYYIHSFDSIYVTGKYQFNLIDSSGYPYFKYNFLQKSSHNFTSMPQLKTVQPLIETKDEIYLHSFPDKSPFKLSSFYGEQGRIIFHKGKNSTTYKYALKYPETYRINIYGPNFMQIYSTYNPKSKLFIYSFPADPNIYIYNENHEFLKKVYVPTSSEMKIEGMQTVDESYSGYTRFYLTHLSYSYIFFDQYRNVYYRVVLHPNTIEEYNEGKGWKNASIIILDKDFKIRGESKIDEYNALSMSFITKDGFFVAKGIPGDEDHLTFVNLTLKDLNE